MSRKFVSLIFALALAFVARADQFTVTNGQTILAVPAVISPAALGAISNWICLSNYPAGSIVKADGIPFVCRYGGTGVATATNIFMGKQTVTDGPVTWIKSSVGTRMAVVAQLVSGPQVDFSFANGKVTFTTAGTALALSEESVYPGNIFVTATGGDAVVNVLWY